MTVALPDRLGRYRVEAVIGSGGFATVYRARDERLDALVAIKVLADNHCLDPGMRERFLKEGRVLRRIGSPHVVAVHDLGETSRGQPYLVLDHADRGDLAARVNTRRATGWRPVTADLLAVAEALGDALAAVHASGLVHRDVAPRNLLLRSVKAPGTADGTALVAPDEQLLLADLGLSKDLAMASGLTVGGGTAGFTPPEQRSGLVRVDATADIWAASALLVWLLAETPPTDEGGWQDRLAGAGWPDALVAALARGLAPDPAHRYDHATTWFAAVRDAVAPTVPIDAPSDPRPGPPAGGAPQPPVKPGRRARRVVLLVVALLVGVAAAAVAARAYDAYGDGSYEAVDELPGGRMRAQATDGPRQVAIVGPRAVSRGETATFTPETKGVVHAVWIAPDGDVHVDAPELRVRTRSAGLATVTLVGVDGDGHRLVATHELEVRAG